ncbi:16S rRNA (guanine(966)-N(2))-methyltransferase RsmD [Mycolicibacterium arseniciresistens]|uniref:16S rRNA (Guanine(966)-N(2))-methyltransferase RsmD n=1 Tax=Mycolicibacterium arseniciresistens TaxID=3062257 RepID=A0ABT8ULR1_9MYCO|nr:16S rRNA (guanine(966)-N(2))-methyltransferase RsmD [Mycolicibacterium arseniciresistens]MDO3638738.1 16S rRNA (guanine(966)-N(2))-methyltransferase RsmD [Mycolicibacterium arseniciresistens]
MTRLIAGALGGRRITVPRSGTRPTTDRVRESLFNVLTARLDLAGLSVLDLYAGSGALGLEAISRGASTVTFVEADRRAAGVIEGNLADLGVRNAHVRKTGVAAALGGAASPVDLVLADPPYDIAEAEIDEMLALLDAGWTRAGTVVVIERRASAAPTRWPEHWTPWPQRRYGDTRLDIAES